MTAIKICGITREEEIEYLNESGVDYAGFVFYEKSRRYLPVAKAKQISGKLNQEIKRVAVTVDPGMELIREIGEAGFDILQVHGIGQECIERLAAHETESGQVIRTELPLWLAANLRRSEEVRRWRPLLKVKEARPNGILLDAGDYGSGKTFGWESRAAGGTPEHVWQRAVAEFRQEAKAAQVTFLLAGGLDAANVAAGIRIFAPDIVDVSSGVEKMSGGAVKKNREKIAAFVKAVRAADIGMTVKD